MPSDGNVSETVTCRSCRSTLPLDQFHVDRSSVGNGRKPVCRQCWNEHQRLRRRWISEGRRGRRCEVCGSTHRLCLDHDWASKSARGTLCARCNTTLGKVEDDPGLLLALAAYLVVASTAGPTEELEA